MEDAKEFLDKLDEKARDKIVYNIWKARSTNDKELFKNFKTKFGNLERNSTKLISDYLRFGTKQTKRIRL